MMRSLVRVAIQDGHRHLLVTLREFDLGGCDGEPDFEALQGFVAFLWQEALQSSHWEEDAPGPGAHAQETVVFEYTFLAAEHHQMESAK